MRAREKRIDNTQANGRNRRIEKLHRKTAAQVLTIAPVRLLLFCRPKSGIIIFVESAADRSDAFCFVESVLFFRFAQIFAQLLFYPVGEFNSPEPRLLLLYLYIQRCAVCEPFPYVGKAEIVFVAAQRREIFYRIRRNYVYISRVRICGNMFSENSCTISLCSSITVTCPTLSESEARYA